MKSPAKATNCSTISTIHNNKKKQDQPPQKDILIDIIRKEVAGIRVVMVPPPIEPLVVGRDVVPFHGSFQVMCAAEIRG
jgi:hypothetical protein